MKKMKKIQEIWNNLPKTIKVFFYISLSTILSEVLIEIGRFEQTFLIRISAQLINLGLVFLGDVITEVKTRIESK